MTLLLLLQLSGKAAAAAEAADKARLEKTLTRLVEFGTRDTFSDTESDERGIGAARRWIKKEVENIKAQHTAGDTIDKISFDTMLKIFTIDVALPATPADAPPAPEGLRVEAADGGVRVDWKALEEVDGYRVAIRHGRNLDFSKVVEAKPGDTIPFDVEEGVSVSVAAIRGGALGPFSAEAEP